MLQELVVGIAVALAALYLGAKYLPDGWRRALVRRFSHGGSQSRLVRWLDAADSCGGGCNSCKTCGDEDKGGGEPSPPPGGKHRVIKLHRKR